MKTSALLVPLLLAPLAVVAAEPVDIGLVEEVDVVSRTIDAVNFRRPGSSGTHMEFASGDLAPKAQGQIDIDAKEGYIQLQSTAWDLPPAATFGDEYMTYVMWAVTPEGRATNLGELVVEDDAAKRSRLEVTSELQTFGMIVTAEPHFGVTLPSDVVVLEAKPTAATRGAIEPVRATYQLLKRGHYAFRGSSRTDISAPSAPFYVLQARNARRIALDQGAQERASTVFAKAEALLAQAEDRKQGKARLGLAKQAAQTFEDARLVSETRAREEREQRAREEADRARREAEIAQRQAEAAQGEASAAQADADAARRQAMMADAALDQAEREKAALREKLRRQFTVLFETRETARGLILSMSNVLFDFNMATLRPEAREKLAKLAGIVLATPGLRLSVEGHADAIGSDEYNQKLSERRAGSVRDYLVGQGVDGASVTARGFGESQPIASNETAEGRQQNRRVEIVVSGDVIGVAEAR